ncbi:MAG: ATP-binding protein [Verrucomicrobiae bacterium]|nr:ATP-binding protein [Verrucomicrobiae bacterium]
MNEKLIITPSINRVTQLVRDCIALEALGAIVGPPGTGKTTALLAIESRYPSLGLPGRPFYYRCCAIQGPARGVKDILVALGLRESLLPMALTLQMAIKAALRELRNQEIRVILADEADSWSLESLQGVVTLMDVCKQKGQPVALILTGCRDLPQWIGGLGSAMSRTLRCEYFYELSVELALSVLRELGAPFAKLCEQVEQGDKDAVGIIKHIHKTTRGNWRRLWYFSQLFLMQEGATEVTMERVKAAFERMTLEKTGNA